MPNPFIETPKIEIPQLPITNFMPAQGEDFEAHGYVALPAIGATAVVVSVLVPEGRNGMIKRIANVFVGAGFTEGQGGIVWQILQDANIVNTLVAPFFDNIVASLGSVNAPSTIDGIRIREGQLVQLIVKNISIAVAGQLVGGRLGGYFYPVELDPPNMGF
jgi:hypothetical protein